jgi:ABC-2 type transport system ATP-binding protein
MDEVGERFVEVMVPSENLAAAKALNPIDERQVFGKSVLLFDGVPRAEVARLGETRNVGIADLFVAQMKGTYA